MKHPQRRRSSSSSSSIKKNLKRLNKTTLKNTVMEIIGEDDALQLYKAYRGLLDSVYNNECGSGELRFGYRMTATQAINLARRFNPDISCSKKVLKSEDMKKDILKTPSFCIRIVDSELVNNCILCSWKGNNLRTMLHTFNELTCQKDHTLETHFTQEYNDKCITTILLLDIGDMKCMDSDFDSTMNMLSQQMVDGPLSNRFGSRKTFPKLTYEFGWSETESTADGNCDEIGFQKESLKARFCCLFSALFFNQDVENSVYSQHPFLFCEQLGNFFKETDTSIGDDYIVLSLDKDIKSITLYLILSKPS